MPAPPAAGESCRDAAGSERALVPPGFPWRLCLLLACISLVLRLGTNLTRVDENLQEGLQHGAHAQAILLDDVDLWPSHAPKEIHFRNTVLFTWLAVPCFALLGPTTFALRCPGILVHLATLLVLMLLVHRHFGRRAALLSGALLVFSPPALAKISVLSYGDHLESLLFTLTAAWLTLRWCDDRSNRRHALALAAGFAAGLAFVYHLQSRVGFAALAVTCAVSAPRKLLARDFWLGFLPGLVLGLLPLVLGDWLTGRDGLTFYGESHLEQATSGLRGAAALKWLRLWCVDFPHALQYPATLLGGLTCLLAGGCFAGLAIATWRARRRDPAGVKSALRRSAFFVAYPLVFSIPYATSSYSIHYELDNAVHVRYLMPLVPIVLLPIAIAAARLLESGRRAAALALAGPALLLGLAGTLSTWNIEAILHEPARTAIVWERSQLQFEYSSLSPADRDQLREFERSTYRDPAQEQKVNALLVRLMDRDKVLDLIERHDNGPAWTRPLRYRIADVAPTLISSKTPAELVQRWASRPPRLSGYAAADALMILAQDRARLPLAGSLLVSGRTESERLLLWHAFGGALVATSRALQFDGALVWKLMDSAPPAVDRDELAFGLGFRVGQFLSEFWDRGWRYPDEFLAHAPPERHAAFARGLGAGYRLRFLEPPPAELQSPAIRNLLSHLPAELEPAFREGLAGASGAARFAAPEQDASHRGG